MGCPASMASSMPVMPKVSGGNFISGFMSQLTLSISVLLRYFTAPISMIRALLPSSPVVSKSKMTASNYSNGKLKSKDEPEIPPIIATALFCDVALL